jgi:methyl-accepting chemotaxis protein
MLNNFKATQVEYVNVVRQTVGLAKNGQMLDAQSLAVEKMQPLQIRLFEEISAMIQTQQASTTSAAAASPWRPSAGDALLMIAAVAALLGIAIAWLFTRYIKRQLGENPLMRCRSSMKLRRKSGHPDHACP